MKNILDKDSQQKIIERLDALNEDTPALWGKMKVNEMLAHLNDAFKIALGMKEAKVNTNFFYRKIVFPIIVYKMKNWKHNLPTAPELTVNKKATPAKDFYTEVTFLKKMLEIFEEREVTKFKPHPLFGDLTKQQWADLLQVHINHHLKQFGV